MIFFKIFFTTSLIFTLSSTIFSQSVNNELREFLQNQSLSLSSKADIFPVLDEISDRRLVLLGEASHGTSEYYVWRAEISKYLVKEHGLSFISVEGDWPSAYEVNRYVKHLPGAAANAQEALANFIRWPHWMWQNEETEALVEWLREYNSDRPMNERVGFYGVDLQNKALSMEVVLEKLNNFDSELYSWASSEYHCLNRYSDRRSYLQAVIAHDAHCGDAMEAVLERVRSLEPGDNLSEEQWFNLWFNAKLVVYAEQNLRSNLSQGPDSWNIRAEHFMRTAEVLLNRYGSDSKGVVWAHNTHIGDARATGMRQAAMVNIGQLARERLGSDNVFLLGFGTYKGTLLAGGSWGADMEDMSLPNAIPGSWEHILYHQLDSDVFIPLENAPTILRNQPFGNRAVGVAYQPESDAQNNYVPSLIGLRYDGFIFFRNTSSLNPLQP